MSGPRRVEPRRRRARRAPAPSLEEEDSGQLERCAALCWVRRRAPHDAVIEAAAMGGGRAGDRDLRRAPGSPSWTGRSLPRRTGQRRARRRTRARAVQHQAPSARVMGPAGTGRRRTAPAPRRGRHEANGNADARGDGLVAKHRGRERHCNRRCAAASSRSGRPTQHSTRDAPSASTVPQHHVARAARSARVGRRSTCGHARQRQSRGRGAGGSCAPHGRRREKGPSDCQRTRAASARRRRRLDGTVEEGTMSTNDPEVRRMVGSARVRAEAGGARLGAGAVRGARVPTATAVTTSSARAIHARRRGRVMARRGTPQAARASSLLPRRRSAPADEGRAAWG